MREMFPGYYRPSGDEYKILWEECFFVLDANVLLNMYRYTRPAREEFLGLLERVQDRIWTPHQAALEYHRNRLNVMESQFSAYDDLSEKINESCKKLTSTFENYARHPVIKSAELKELVNQACEGLGARIDQWKLSEQTIFGEGEITESDHILDKLTKMLVGRVGNPFNEAEMTAFYDEARARYARRQPPGYRDSDKDEPNCFNDLIIWYQVIDEAKERSRPVILVTDDAKEDWWRIHKGKTVGPRPELVDEIRQKAGVDFYMYRPPQFLKWANDALNQSVSSQTIDEIVALDASRDQAMKIDNASGYRSLDADSESALDRLLPYERELYELNLLRQRLDHEINDLKITLDTIETRHSILRDRLRATKQEPGEEGNQELHKERIRLRAMEEETRERLTELMRDHKHFGVRAARIRELRNRQMHLHLQQEHPEKWSQLHEEMHFLQRSRPQEYERRRRLTEAENRNQHYRKADDIEDDEV